MPPRQPMRGEILREWVEGQFYSFRYLEVKHLLGTVCGGPSGDWRMVSSKYHPEDKSFVRVWRQLILPVPVYR